MLFNSGIPDNQWPAAIELIQRESSWTVGIINPDSGACGLQQELPCGKSGCDVNDATCGLSWQWDYVQQRYGDYFGAIVFHDLNNYY